MAEHRVFDAHLHLIDPRFPLQANQGYLPEPFTIGDYRRRLEAYCLRGGAVVSASFQGFDQSWLLTALTELGPEYVGVSQVPATISDAELRRFDRAGVRAVRFNLRRGGSEGLAQLERMAHRVYEVAGWHVELYVDARSIPPIETVLHRLPAVSVDHLGLTADGLPTLERLAGAGIRIKATGFGRVDFDVASALQRLHAANPACLMFGTDLPSTRAPRPYRDQDLDLIVDALGESGANRVLYRNAIELYRPRAATAEG